MRTLNFGIEIETVGLSKERVARAIQTVVGGVARASGSGWEVQAPDGRIWRAVPDGSLNGFENAEIVSPILGYGDLEQLQSIVRAVRESGGRADSSCGIHIHVDGARFDGKTLANLAKIIHKQERLIETALGIQQHRLSRYCQPIDSGFIARLEATRPTELSSVNEAWYGRLERRPSRYDYTRYHGLNLNSFFYRKTIEFRYFEGTLHAGKVKAYVQFCLALAAKALKAKSSSSKRREFNAATAKYDFRVFLLGLGMIGDEFKTARLHLLDRLDGSAAWKHGRPAARPATAPVAPPEAAAAE
jgi:hypothetical protein